MWLGSSDGAMAQMAIRMKTREDDMEADEKALGESSYKSPAKGTYVSCCTRRCVCYWAARSFERATENSAFVLSQHARGLANLLCCL